MQNQHECAYPDGQTDIDCQVKSTSPMESDSRNGYFASQKPHSIVAMQVPRSSRVPFCLSLKSVKPSFVTSPREEREPTPESHFCVSPSEGGGGGNGINAAAVFALPQTRRGRAIITLPTNHGPRLTAWLVLFSAL